MTTPTPSARPDSHPVAGRSFRTAGTLAIASLLFGGALAGGLIAGASFAPNPAVTCTVDLSKLFSQSNLNVNLNVRIKAMNDDLEARVKSIEDKIKLKRDELELFAENSPRWAAAQQEFQELIGSLNAEKKFAQDKMGVEGAKAIAEMYRSVRSVIEAYSKAQGIDYVMLNDSLARILPADPEKTMDQIAQRRFLYATDAYDITDAILFEMNKTYPLVPGATPPTGSNSTTPSSTGGANGGTTAAPATGASAPAS